MVPGRKLYVEAHTILAQSETPHRADQLEHLHELFILDTQSVQVFGRPLVQELDRISAQLLEDGHSQVVVVRVRENVAEDLLAGYGRNQLILILERVIKYAAAHSPFCFAPQAPLG